MDMTLLSYAPVRDSSFEEDLDNFLKLLARLQRTSMSADGWFVPTPEFNGDESGFDPMDPANRGMFLIWDKRAKEIAGDYFGESDSPSETIEVGPVRFTAIRPNEPTKPTYEIEYISDHRMLLTRMDFRRPHDRYGTSAGMYIELIDAIVEWQRPLHLFLSPTRYFMDHHPLDRSRKGIGWMGWIPFDLPADELPEAEIVRPVRGGTLIVTQSAFWQAFERHPAYSPQAIERAQEVELKLAMLGLLPTSEDLQSNDWGK